MSCDCVRKAGEYNEHLKEVRRIAKKYAIKHGITVAIFKSGKTCADFREFDGNIRTRDIEYLTAYDQENVNASVDGMHV